MRRCARCCARHPRGRQVFFVGHELTERSVAALRDGVMSVVLDQAPEAQARRAIDLMLKQPRPAGRRGRHGPDPLRHGDRRERLIRSDQARRRATIHPSDIVRQRPRGEGFRRLEGDRDGRSAVRHAQQARRLVAERADRARAALRAALRPKAFLKWLPHYFLPWNLIFAALGRRLLGLDHSTGRDDADPGLGLAALALRRERSRGVPLLRRVRAASLCAQAAGAALQVQRASSPPSSAATRSGSRARTSTTSCAPSCPA